MKPNGPHRHQIPNQFLEVEVSLLPLRHHPLPQGKLWRKHVLRGPEPRSLFQPEASPVPSQPDTGATRAPSLDDVACLKQRNQELEDEKIALEKQVEELNEKLNQLSLNQRSQEQSGDDGANAPAASDEAARKRLARICSRNSAGRHGWYRGG